MNFLTFVGGGALQNPLDDNLFSAKGPVDACDLLISREVNK